MLFNRHMSVVGLVVVRGYVRRRHVHSDEYMLGDGVDGARRKPPVVCSKGSISQLPRQEQTSELQKHQLRNGVAKK